MSSTMDRKFKRGSSPAISIQANNPVVLRKQKNTSHLSSLTSNTEPSPRNSQTSLV